MCCLACIVPRIQTLMTYIDPKKFMFTKVQTSFIASQLAPNIVLLTYSTVECPDFVYLNISGGLLLF